MRVEGGLEPGPRARVEDGAPRLRVHIAARGPTWCGPHHIVLGTDVLALTNREPIRITDETEKACVTPNHDGAVLVGRDARGGSWRARTRVGT